LWGQAHTTEIPREEESMIPDITAPKDHDIVVVGPGNWGSGKTLKEATNNARRFGPVRQGEYEAWFVPEGSGVDMMGYHERHRECDICQIIVHATKFEKAEQKGAKK